MYYEVYVDVLFVKNLWMNVLLLFLTAWADHAPVRNGRIVLAALAGSLGACLLTIASPWLTGISWFLGNVLLAAGMVRAAYPGWHHFGVRMVMLYLECFVMNGALRYLEQYHRLSGVWFIAFSGASFVFLTTAEWIRRNRKKQREITCQAVLQLGAGLVRVEALCDTGNSLYDPISKKPVSILDGQLLDDLLEQSCRENLPRFIPYHTITQHGILEAYVLDRMELEGEKGKCRVERPVVARMPEADREYQLILHRDLLSS